MRITAASIIVLVCALAAVGLIVNHTADADGHYRAVPPGGTVHVFVTCRVPSQILGGFGFPGLDAERKAVAVATVDPYRFRPGA